MSVEAKNVRNKKALGLSSQSVKCGWIRVLEEESGSGENGSGTPDKTYEGERRTNLTPPEP